MPKIGGKEVVMSEIYNILNIKVLFTKSLTERKMLKDAYFKMTSKMMD